MASSNMLSLLVVIIAATTSAKTPVSSYIEELLTKFSCDKVLYLHDQSLELEFDANVSLYNMQSCSALSDLQHNCYVISYVTLQQLDVELNRVYYKVGFSSQHFVVFVSSRKLQVLDVFKVLWKYFLRNALVLTEKFELYKAESGQVKLVSKVAALRFEDEIANNTLRIMMSPIMPFVGEDYKVGLDVAILDELLRRLRLHPEYVAYVKEPSFSNFGHGNYSREMQQVYDHDADLILAGLAYIFDRANDFDKTYIHALAKGAFFVPVAKPVSPWRSLVMIFHCTTWIATCASLLSTTFFYLKLGGNNAWTIYNILFTPAPKQPKLFKLRLIFIAWTYTVLVLISSYQSLLVLFLFKPVYHPQASTVQEMVASGITIGGFPAVKDFFLHANSTNLYIYENFYSCPRSGTKCYNRVVHDEDLALYRIDRLMFYQLQFNKTHRAHMISPSQVLYMCFYLPKASPFTQKLSEMIVLMWDVGLIEKWDVYRTGFVYKKSDKTSQPITLGHFLLVVGIYCFGLVMSAVAFVFELVNSSQIRTT